MKKRMVLITALALCAGLLCGCGDGGPAPGSTPAEGSLPESQVSLAGADSSQGGEESEPVIGPPQLMAPTPWTWRRTSPVWKAPEP